MEWDLALLPEDAAQLSHLKLLAPLREGRARSRAVRIVWHDGPDAPLAKSGLALVEQRGFWRLERMRPSADARRGLGWPPGMTPPVLAEAATYKALAAAIAASETGEDAASLPKLPDPCMPWAAFEGRALSLSLRHAGDTIELTVLHGAIRTVMHEHPTCRLLIHGPAEASTTIALQLAQVVELSVPRASLAEDALAAARGSAPQPRALGAPVLSKDFSVAEAFDHILAHLTDAILYWAPLAAAGDDGPEPVHQMRVATRRLRSAFSVFRRATASPGVAEADAGLKTLAAILGPARDWDVFNTGVGAEVGAAFDGERPEGQALTKLLAATERQRVSSYDAIRAFLATPEFRRLGLRLAALAATRSWEADIDEAAHTELEIPLEDFAGAVLTRRWRRMSDVGKDIRDLETEELHRIRLRAKRLRYAAEFFASLYPAKPSRRFIRRLSVLQDRLGWLNDGAVAAGLLETLPGNNTERAFAVGAVRGFVAARGGSSRAGVARAWNKFRKQEPFWI